eukprot:TRINITY_DN1715_c0_g1_i4.p1 TRINITY_DN1715_c0_g1~~TRINITY_DN1715_c0_g1_i4.p1  ORF type:complete len:206 (-),score=43.58 TRINITY_DN1715_c0_g1_i4:11-628(-)
MDEEEGTKISMVAAVKRGLINEMKELLEAEEDPNLAVCGNSPLHYAARYRRPEACTLLLNYGADINKKNLSGIVPLLWAIESGDVNTVSVFLEYQCDATIKSNKGDTALHKAARNGNITIVQQLIDYGVEVDSYAGSGMDERSVLMEATRSNNVQLVQYLLDEGADITYQNKNGRTALHSSVYFNNEEVAKLLIGEIIYCDRSNI